MYKIIISRLRRGTRRSSGNTCSIKKLLCMESRKDLYNKNASEKGVDMVSLDRDTMIRISKNPGWYQDFYKSYGRAPNVRELYDISHKKMEDGVYCNLDKADAKGMAEKETMKAAKRRVESLERVKDIVNKFDDGDIAAQSLLEPETYEQAYKPTVETFSLENAVVKKSARESALILSKMAENFHKNYGVLLQIALIVSVRTAPGDAAQVYEEMFDVSRAKNPATSLKDFYDRIKDRKKAKLPENKIKYTGKYGVTYAEERVVHLMRDHPEITPDVLNDIEDHINELENLEPSKWKNGEYIGPYHGKVYTAQINGETGDYGVVLEFCTERRRVT